jgi:TrmH family RNA methyltransferase
LDGFALQDAQVELVSDSVMQAASDTRTPQGLLVALESLDLPLPPQPDFLVVPDQIRDPGNLGAVLRTAGAAGVDAVLLPPETVDAFAPKTLRSGMGAHFRLPLRELDWDEIAFHLQGLQVYLAAADEGLPYTATDFHSPLALIVGGEAEGASQTARQLAASCTHIPMPGGGESLNAAVAAGILMFEVVRQRQIRR